MLEPMEILCSPVTVLTTRAYAGSNALQFSEASATWTALVDGGNPATAADVPNALPFTVNYSPVLPPVASCVLVCSGDQNITLAGGQCSYILPKLETVAGSCVLVQLLVWFLDQHRYSFTRIISYWMNYWMLLALQLMIVALPLLYCHILHHHLV
ncbi:MAG: hypothetical protein IPO26_20455 [Saprospiraceae bacterium]|nr:hypothetical protein [Saprospiraceae bacterium]